MKLITIPDSLVDSQVFVALKRCGFESSSINAFFFFHFSFDLLVSLSLFFILCSPGYIYLNLACVYVKNKAQLIISISLRVITCNSLHAKHFLRLLLSSADF